MDDRYRYGEAMGWVRLSSNDERDRFISQLTEVPFVARSAYLIQLDWQHYSTDPFGVHWWHAPIPASYGMRTHCTEQAYSLQRYTDAYALYLKRFRELEAKGQSQ